MSKLSIKQRQWVLSFHIISAALWTGAVISLLLVEWMNYQNPNLALNALDRVVNNIDHEIIIPAAISSVLTATVLCWGTNYGFTKFYWVVTKWIVTVALILFGTFFLDPWGVNSESISAIDPVKAIESLRYQFNTKGILIGGSGNFISLLAIVFISFLKPWGRINKISPKSDEEIPNN
jgi:uncharacterized membrane protein SirB2